MTMHVPAGRLRGIRSARADTSSAQTLFEELRRTVETFKAEHKAELDGIKKNFADVVQVEKVDRINAEIGELQKSLDQVNAVLAALRLGGGGDGGVSNPAVAEHKAAFEKWFRTGDGQAGLSDLEVKAMLTTQSKPDGGYVTPTTMEATIDRVLGTVSAVRGLATTMSIGTAGYTKLVNMGGGAAGWVGEEDARTETGTPVLRALEFPLAELYAEPYATQIALDDATLDLEQWLADEVSIAFADKEGAAFVAGDGVKKPRGLLSYDTVANASYAWGKIGYVVSGAANGLAATAPADALIDLFYALKAGYRANASWLTADGTMGALRKLKDADGNYLWAPPASSGAVPTILEKPVATDDNMPAIGAGAFPILFGDFKRSYLILDRVGIRVLRNPYKVNGKVAFYTTKRVGGGIQNFEALKFLKISA